MSSAFTSAWITLLPVLAVAVTILIVMLQLSQRVQGKLIYGSVFVGLVVAKLALFLPLFVDITGDGPMLFSDVRHASMHFVMDGFARVMLVIVLLASMIALLLVRAYDKFQLQDIARIESGSLDSGSPQSGYAPQKRQGSVYIPFLLVVMGSMLLVMANSSMGLFVSSELLGLGAIGLLVLYQPQLSVKNKSDHTQTSLFHVVTPYDVKQHVLSHGVITAVLLFGISLLFAATGGIAYVDVRRALLYDVKEMLLLLGSVVVMFAVIYRMGLVPLQSRLVDVVKRVPMPLWYILLSMGLLSLGAAWVRLLVTTAIPAIAEVTYLLTAMMLLALFVPYWLMRKAISLPKRLTYLLLAQFGYALAVLMALGEDPQAVFVVASYLLIAFLALSVVAISMSLIAEKLSSDSELTLDMLLADARHFNQSYQLAPVLTVIMSIGLFALVGLPLTFAFIVLFFALLAMVQGFSWFLLAAVVLSIALGWYVLLPQVLALFISSPTENKKPARVAGEVRFYAQNKSRALCAVLGVLLLILVGFGLYPEPLIEMLKLARIG